MENTKLYNSLIALYKTIETELFLAKKNGLLTKIPYEKIYATNINYTLESFQLDWANIEYYDLFVWSTDAFHSFKDKIEVLPEFRKTVDEVCITFEIPTEKRKYAEQIGVFGFVRHLMNEIPNGRISNDNISSKINTFLNDYKIYKSDNKFTWQIKIWLDSIYFDEELINLSHEVTIRKPRLDELHVIRQKSHYIDDFSKLGRGLPSASILEFSMKAETQLVGLYHDDIRQEIENWLDALRLFKVGNINAIYKSIMPISVLEHGTTENSESSFDKSWKDKIDYCETSNYKYPIKKEEADQLFLFAQKLKPILKSISQKAYLKGSYLDLAFHRYKDALLRSEVNVNRMVSAITCLEALLSNSSSEITYKISIHVAGVLKHLGFDSVKVFEKMKTAYEVRSKLLHGSNLEDKLLKFSNNHAHEIVNYARICLLVSMQLKDKINKNELIKKIDHALVDQNSNSELKKLINENVYLPIVYPFREIDGGDEFK